MPENDRQIRPNVPLPPIHEDVTVTNQLSRLIVSFRWRTLLTDSSLKNDLSQWIDEPLSESPTIDVKDPPNFIFIGLLIFNTNYNTHLII